MIAGSRRLVRERQRPLDDRACRHGAPRSGAGPRRGRSRRAPVAHRAGRGGLRGRARRWVASSTGRRRARSAGRFAASRRAASRCGRCGPVITPPLRWSGGSPSVGRRPRCGARWWSRPSAPDSSMTAGSRVPGRAARRPRRRRSADRRRPRASGGSGRSRRSRDRRARARIGPGRRDHHVQGPKCANGPIPGLQGLLRSEPGAARCRSRRRRVRMRKLHPTFILHRAHS